MRICLPFIPYILLWDGRPLGNGAKFNACQMQPRSIVNSLSLVELGDEAVIYALSVPLAWRALYPNRSSLLEPGHSVR